MLTFPLQTTASAVEDRPTQILLQRVMSPIFVFPKNLVSAAARFSFQRAIPLSLNDIMTGPGWLLYPFALLQSLIEKMYRPWGGWKRKAMDMFTQVAPG